MRYVGLLKMMKKTLFTLMILAVVTGCTTLGPNGKLGFTSPNYLFLRNLPQGDDAYSVGFREGCYNFIGQVGYGMARFYDAAPSNDPAMITDKLYKMGYMHGDRHCVVYANKGIIL